MAERVTVRQDRKLQIDILAPDRRKPESEELTSVHYMQELTPYGMLLAALGSCTTVVTHTYARNHGINLKEVEVRLEYRRNFEEDCEHCEEIDRYEEKINEEIEFDGDLTDEDREKLHRAADLCSIRQMLEQGVPVR